MLVEPLDAERRKDNVPTKRRGTYYPVTRRHIPEERSPQPHLSENLKTRHLWYPLEAFGYVSQQAI